jgi:superfamily II DNA or RNA helicase
LIDLQHQWELAIKKDLKVPYRIYKFGGGSHENPRKFRLSTNTATSKYDKFVSIAICVYDTYFSGFFKELQSGKGETLIIVDEAHNLTPGNIQILEKVSKYRLGLSATPSRFSKWETSLLLALFLKNKQSPYLYSLEEAIQNGFLSRYEYIPLCVELTEDESSRYENESRRIAVLYNKYENEPSADNRKKMEDALLARSRIVKKAYNKISLLEKLVSSAAYDFHNSVVFCGPAKLIKDGVETEDRIIDLVTKAIGRNESKSYFPAKYTSGENDRPARLEGFRQGLTDTLVAINCFDEGLDVPALDKIYLMSSDSSLRQTIQRRGRVLRISKDTGKTIAHIYDMVAGTRIGDKFYPLQTELSRVYEYSRLSINPNDSAEILSHYVHNEDGVNFDEIENND